MPRCGSGRTNFWGVSAFGGRKPSVPNPTELLEKKYFAEMIQYAQENFDYVFSVDSDVLMKPITLKLLIKDDKDIVANIYWTDFNGKGMMLPNCYDYEGCQFNQKIGGIGRFKIMGLYDVGVVGACTLIGERVIDNPYINYYPIKNISSTKWEDQAFITRARCLIPDISVCVDTRYPARHLYRQSEYELWMKDKAEYYGYEE